MRSPLLALLAVLTALALASGPARADGLSAREIGDLFRGQSVTRTQTLDRGGRHYVGGVTYAILDADADDVARVFDSVDAWNRVLPELRSARAVGTVGEDPLIEVMHGSVFLQVVYTMRVHRETRGNGVTFRLEHRFRHDIEDVWGSLRAEPLADGRTMLTYGVLIDMGPGLLRDLFEDRVRETALTIPERIRGLVAETSSAGRRAAR